MEVSHLLHIIEDADAEETEGNENTDEDDEEDDSALLCVEIYCGTNHRGSVFCLSWKLSCAEILLLRGSRQDHGVRLSVRQPIFPPSLVSLMKIV